jgi:putative oxidoreductase
MNPALTNTAALVGRIQLALMFVVAGVGKIGGFDGTVGYIASKGLPLPVVLAAGTVALEIVAGVALIVGYRARWAALALAAFTLLATVIFHAYWAVPAEQQMVQRLMFLKNIAVTGGLLVVFAFGAGRYGLDKA